MWCLEARRLLGLAGVGLVLGLLHSPSHAVLGGQVLALVPAPGPGSAPTLTRKPMALPGQVLSGIHIHTHVSAEGAQVREYSGPDGVVFAVAWSTRSKPRLDLLLGPYFESYAAAARVDQNGHRRPRHAAAIEQGDLIVQSQGHAQAFSGRAVLRSRLPVGMALADVN